MGRKYAKVEISTAGRRQKGLIGLIDTGADLTIISTNAAKRLRLKSLAAEMEWSASDGDKRSSPIVELTIKAEDDDKSIKLDVVLIDDLPMDEETGEQVILGLDYLQRAKKVLSFDD